jgi:hypothetical protein
MIHEATVQHSIYSPDTSSPRLPSPVFVPSFAGQRPTPIQCSSLTGGSGNQMDGFLAELTTPIRPALLPVPDVNAHRHASVKVAVPAIASAQRHSAHLLSKRRSDAKLENFSQEILSKKFGFMDDHASYDDNVKKLYLQHFNKPLSLASLKTISELVEKGGCKAIRLKAAKKKAVVAPL